MEESIQHEFNQLNNKLIIFTINTTSPILDDDYNFETCLRKFSLVQQQKILNKKIPQDRKKALLNQILLYFISGLATSNLSNWNKIPFNYSQYGKPFIKDSNFQFSLSNSQDLVAMCIEKDSSKDIGIDLSNLKDIVTDLELYKPIFHNIEYENLLKHHHSELEWKKLFNQYWALKESYTKLLGVGLNIDLSGFYFHPVKLLPFSESDRIRNNFFNVRKVQWDKNVKLRNVDREYSVRLGQVDSCNILSVITQNVCDPLLVEINFEKLFQFM